MMNEIAGVRLKMKNVLPGKAQFCKCQLDNFFWMYADIVGVANAVDEMLNIVESALDGIMADEKN